MDHNLYPIVLQMDITSSANAHDAGDNVPVVEHHGIHQKSVAS